MELNSDVFYYFLGGLTEARKTSQFALACIRWHVCTNKDDEVKVDTTKLKSTVLVSFWLYKNNQLNQTKQSITFLKIHYLQKKKMLQVQQLCSAYLRVETKITRWGLKTCSSSSWFNGPHYLYTYVLHGNERARPEKTKQKRGHTHFFLLVLLCISQWGVDIKVPLDPVMVLTWTGDHLHALGDSLHTVCFPRVLCQLLFPGRARRVWIWHYTRRTTTHRHAHASVTMWCHAVQCMASFFLTFVYSKLLQWLYHGPLLPRRNHFTHNICSMKEK